MPHERTYKEKLMTQRYTVFIGHTRDAVKPPTYLLLLRLTCLVCSSYQHTCTSLRINHIAIQVIQTLVKTTLYLIA